MTYSVALQTQSRVMARFIDLSRREMRAHQMFDWLGDDSNSAYPLPKAPTPTSVSLSTRAAPSAFAPEQEVLNVNETVGYNTLIPMPQQSQLLGGGVFVDRLGDEHFEHAMNSLDDAAYQKLLDSCVANAGLNTAAFSGGNVTNADLSAVTTSLVGRHEADLVSNGSNRRQFIRFASPRAYSALRELYRNQVDVRATEAASLGVRFDTVTINGIPTMELQSMPDIITVAATDSSITSNVITITVPEGHGLQVGMPITTSGGSANITTAVAITSASATEVQAPLTASNDATNGALTVTCDAAVSMLFPRNKAFWAGSIRPTTRVVQDPEVPMGSALQVGALYGGYVMQGFGRMLLFPN